MIKGINQREVGMPEYQYRGYRIRTHFDKTWQIKVWPPLTPAKLTERVQASRAEGEDACRLRATAMIDKALTRKTRGGAPHTS